MASHQIAIAKASFSAGLLRPDPTSVPRDEITAFHTLLDRALSHCTPANIQTCKSWLLDYVVSSSNRVGVWAKYLVALSESFAEDAKETGQKTSAKRKRLHVLYVLNDLFHHAKYHLDTSMAFSTLSAASQPYIVELIGLAALYDREKNPKHHKRLDELLDIWDANGYYASDYVGKLREVVRNSTLTGPVKASGVEEDKSEPLNKLPPRQAPFIMPPTHGDPSTPYYDLPAGNMVPHIIPNSTVSLRPDSVKPLQFLAGPADEKLVDAVKVFLHDVDRIYGTGKPEQKEDEIIDIDELGHTVIRDSITNEIIDGETYYGWSRAFCQQMKRNGANSRSRTRSRSRSRSRDNYRNRYSDSPDSRRLSSRSRSRSRSPPRWGFRRRDGSYSRSRSRSRRRSPPRERSYSPPAAPRFRQGEQSAPYPPPQSHFPGPYPPGTGIQPPPYPQNYHGAWPPPPPPMNYPPPPSMNPSAYPPFFQPGGYFPQPHMGQQQMPPGMHHFPPPHPGSWQGGYGRGWH